MKKRFIKVLSPEIADKLATLGFTYIKEQNFYAFPYSDELAAVVQQKFAKMSFVNESKLRF